jgi:hypothetical protein
MIFSGRMYRMLVKLAEYEQMGIAAIWLIEPTKQFVSPLSRGPTGPRLDF